MKRILAALLFRAFLLLPTPPKQPMTSCGSCGSSNEPSRTRCRNCGASI